MAANTTIQQKAIEWDEMAVVLRPYITQDGTLKGGPHWSAEKIDWSIGADPSSCTCRIPLRDLDDIAPAVAAVQTSPAAGMRLLASGQVRLVTSERNASGDQTNVGDAIVFRGLVTKISHEFGPKADFAMVRMEDARWLLKRTPIIGRWEVISDDSTTDAFYRQGWAAHPNEGGEPNAIWCEMKGCFAFCAPRLGLANDEVPPSWTDRNTRKATWWTDSMLVDYLRMSLHNFPSATGRGKPPYSLLPDGIVWPVGLAEPLRTLAIGHAHSKDESLEGRSVADVLSAICRHAGAFDITMVPYCEQPTLQIIQTAYPYVGGGITLNRPDAENNIAGPKIIIGGELSEDADEFYSKVTVAGALTFVERRIATQSSGLMPAWSSGTSGEAVTYLNARLAEGKSLKDSLKLTFGKYPDWLGAWKLDPEFDFHDGISQLNGFSRLPVNRPVLDRLLTSYVEGTGTSDVTDRAQWRRPVFFEYRYSGTDTWTLCSAGDNLQVDAQGTIRLYGLRERVDGYNSEAFYCEPKDPLTSGVSVITGVELRVTVGIPCDHRVTASFKHPSSPEDCAVPEQTFDAERVESGVTGGHAYLLGAREDGGGTFRQEFRQSAWPIPESVAGSNAYADGVIWQDTGAISGAAARQAERLSRLKRGGSLIIPRLSASFTLGQLFASIQYSDGAYPLKSVLTKITWNNTPGTQRTVLEMSA